MDWRNPLRSVIGQISPNPTDNGSLGLAIFVRKPNSIYLQTRVELCHSMRTPVDPQVRTKSEEAPKKKKPEGVSGF